MSTACAHESRPVVDCPACGARGIARCACFADVKCPAHAQTPDTLAEYTPKAFTLRFYPAPGDRIIVRDDAACADAVLVAIRDTQDRMVASGYMSRADVWRFAAREENAR